MPETEPSRLNADQCREHAAACQRMAGDAMNPEHRIMLKHMADTWMRIAQDMDKNNR